MKCIYYNNESVLSVPDIIPEALTGASLRKRFSISKKSACLNSVFMPPLLMAKMCGGWTSEVRVLF